MKAFDKVSHGGLILKLHELKIPSTMGLWLVDFLNNRKFKVIINELINN
jgi:hypothetical protein